MHSWFSSRSVLLIAVAIVSLVSIAWVLDQQHRAALRNTDAAHASVQSKQLPAAILDRENLHDADEVVHHAPTKHLHARGHENSTNVDSNDDAPFSYHKRRQHDRRHRVRSSTTPKPSGDEPEPVYSFGVYAPQGDSCGIPIVTWSLDAFEGQYGCIDFPGYSAILEECAFDPIASTTTMKFAVLDYPCFELRSHHGGSRRNFSVHAPHARYAGTEYNADDAKTDKNGCFLVHYEPIGPNAALAKISCPPY